MLQYKRMPNLAFVHGKTLIASLVLAFFGGSMVWRFGGIAVPERNIDIGVEHPAPFGLRLAVGGNAQTRFIEVGNEGKDPIAVSLPERWRRREVREVPLASITSAAPDQGFVRWSMPGGAKVTFHTQEHWTSLTVHNASPSPFKILFTKVDIEQQTTEHDVLLIDKKPAVIR